MTINPNDVVQVTAVLNYDDSSEMLNVFHVKHYGTVGVEDIDFTGGAADWLDGAYTNIVYNMGTPVQFKEIRFYNVTQDRPMLAVDWPTLTVGQGSDDTNPLQVAALVIFRTAQKRSVGRKYLSGLEESAINDGGRISSAVLGNLTLWASDLQFGFEVDTNPMEPGNYRPLTGEHFQWLAHQERTIAHTQRRRVIGTGV